MGWGQARRPKISNKLGFPNRSEGSDGDIQVRQTGIGARLFAKLGGRWLSNVLHGNEIDSPDIILPKAWVHRGTTAPMSGANLSTTVTLPGFITNSNIISWQVFVEQTFGSQVYLAPVKFGAASEAQALDIQMTVFLIGSSSIRLQGGTGSDDIADKPFMLTVFFK